MNQSGSKRALLILEILTGRPDGVGLTEICETLEMPKSIGHRLLTLLMELGYVMQHDPSGRYGLTLKLTMLGLRHYVRTGLDDLAQPILDRLAAETGELARLAVVVDERLVWVAKAQGARTGLRYDPDWDQDTGHDVVLHATATGKAWLATLPEAQALRIVAATRFQPTRRYGPKMVTTLSAFKPMLKATRLAGYGIALDEGEHGTAAVAVAVLNELESDRGRSEPKAVGTLSLAGPLLRFGKERRSLFVTSLRKAAQELGSIWPLRHSSSPAAMRLPAIELTPSRHRKSKHDASPTPVV